MARALTVATYNLLHGMHLGATGEIDLDAVAAVIADLGADIVAVQEVDRGLPRSGGADQVSWLAGALGFSGVFVPALLGDPERAWVAPDRDDPGGPAYGIGLLSRRPITDWRRLRLPGGGDGRRTRPASPQRPGWDREPRAALIATVRTEAGPLRVVTTHLSYLPWRGLAQLRTVARAIAGADPVVLLGDLNLTPRPVRLALPGWDHHAGPPTYPSWNPSVQIDHIVTRSLTAGEVRVHPRTTSDHLPLVADVTPVLRGTR